MFTNFLDLTSLVTVSISPFISYKYSIPSFTNDIMRKLIFSKQLDIRFPLDFDSDRPRIKQAPLVEGLSGGILETLIVYTPLTRDQETSLLLEILNSVKTAVFHVKDQLGNKVANELVAGYIQQAIDVRMGIQNSGIVNENTGKTEISSEHTAIEMIGINRPGLFSEISAVLAEERCNIVEAHAWSHNTCLACVAYVSDQSTSTFIDDPNRLATIEDHLSTVLQPATMPDNDHKGVNTCFHGCNSSMSRTERRLHQLMLANRDFEVPSRLSSSSFSSMGMHHDNAEERRMVVSIDRCSEKGYSIVNVRCMDRPKLMFDIVCTLTDMQYVIFHASITSHGPFAYQEYYIRHRNGYMLNTTKERQQVSKCLEAAIERRVCEGVQLELCAQNSVGLLPYVTRILREYGLTVARADIAAHGDKMKNVFYVQDISGKEVDMGMLEPMMRELEPLAFQVKNEPLVPQRLNTMERESFSFSSLLRSQLERLSHTFI